MPGKTKEKWYRYGKWLEKYLSPDIEPWDFGNLIKESLSLIKADIPLNSISVWTHHLNEVWQDGVDKLHYTKDMGPFNQQTMKKLIGYDQPKAMSTNRTEFQMNVILSALKVREIADSILFSIHKAGIPWQRAVPQIIDNNPEYLNFLHSYPTISENLRIKRDKVQITREMHMVSLSSLADTSEPVLLSLNLESLASKILFDFLRMDAQEYITYCAYCGRFAVAARRNSKEFCSDRCRTNFRQKPDGIVKRQNQFLQRPKL